LISFPPLVTIKRFTSFQPKNQAKLVNQPMVGGTSSTMKKQGFWPECLGKTGDECKHLIETYAEDLRGHVKVLPPDSMVTMDYNTQRVWIWTDEGGIVNQIPKRG